MATKKKAKASKKVQKAAKKAPAKRGAGPKKETKRAHTVVDDRKILAAGKTSKTSKSPPKLNPRQLQVMKRLAENVGAGIDATAFDKRTLRSLTQRSLVTDGRTVKLTATGKTLMGAVTT